MAAFGPMASPMTVPHSDNAPESLHFGHRVELPTGLTLGSRDRAGVTWTIESLDGWHQTDSTGTQTRRSGRHGAWLDRAFYPARIIVVEGKAFVPSSLTHEEQYRLISGASDRLLASIPFDEAAEIAVTEGGRTRLVRARQDGPQFFDIQSPGTWATFSVQLVAPDPRRLSEPKSVSTSLPVTEGGLVIPARWV